MDLSWHALNSMLQVKTLYHPENQEFGYPGFQKKFQMHPPKPAEAEPSFRKVSLPPAKLRLLFLSHLWVREFGHNSHIIKPQGGLNHDVGGIVIGKCNHSFQQVLTYKRGFKAERGDSLGTRVTYHQKMTLQHSALTDVTSKCSSKVTHAVKKVEQETSWE